MTLLEFAEKIAPEENKKIKVVYHGTKLANDNIHILMDNYDDYFSKEPTIYKEHILIETTTDKFKEFINSKVGGRLSNLHILYFQDENGILKITLKEWELEELATCYFVETIYGEHNYEEN